MTRAIAAAFLACACTIEPDVTVEALEVYVPATVVPPAPSAAPCGSGTGPAIAPDAAPPPAVIVDADVEGG